MALHRELSCCVNCAFIFRSKNLPSKSINYRPTRSSSFTECARRKHESWICRTLPEERPGRLIKNDLNTAPRLRVLAAAVGLDVESRRVAATPV